MAVDALCPGLAALQLVDGARADDHRVDIERLRKLLLPRLTEIGRAQYAEAADLAAIVQLQPPSRLLFPLYSRGNRLMRYRRGRGVGL